jgi:beta-xylosidase
MKSRPLAVACAVVVCLVLSPLAGAQAAQMGTRVTTTDSPDPFVLVGNDGRYYAYSTQVGVSDVPVSVSTDLKAWKPAGNALGRLATWARPGRTWAPSVIERGGVYVLYYTAWNRLLDRQCIGLATAASPTGPFVDVSAIPFICQVDRHGSIDASPFLDDDGRLFLLWKSEENATGGRTTIWSQELSADGLFLEGTPREVLKQSQRWESPVVEGPAMVKHEGVYHLFYGGGWWESAGAGIGWATCSSPVGPCSKPLTNAWVATAAGAIGRAGAEVFRDRNGTLKLAHHAWPDTVGYASGGRRALYIGTLGFSANDRPVLRSL